MSKKKVSLNKAKISKMVSKLERNYVQALNDLDRVIALNEMEDLMVSEIEKWGDLLTHDSDLTDKEFKKLTDAIAIEVSNLQSVVDMIGEERKQFLESAKAIYSARKNSHVAVQEVRNVSYDL